MMAARQYDEDSSPIGGAPIEPPPSAAGRAGAFRLRFESLNPPRRVLDFPCDPGGRVNLDALCEAERRNYLFARAVVGRAYRAPVVVDDASAPR